MSILLQHGVDASNDKLTRAFSNVVRVVRPCFSNTGEPEVRAPLKVEQRVAAEPIYEDHKAESKAEPQGTKTRENSRFLLEIEVRKQ